MEDQKVYLELSVQEANTVIAALAEMPYRMSANLIASVQGQAQAQLQPKGDEQ